MKILRCTLADARQIFDLEHDCLSAPWSMTDIENALAQNSGYLILKAISQDGDFMGCGGVQIIADEGGITNIAVAQPFRRQGVADALLSEIIAACACAGVKKIFLEVYKGNTAAIMLYKKHGFKEAYTRKDYYKEGDAIVFSCEVLCTRLPKE